LIQSAARHGKSLKRFVLTGSIIVETLSQMDPATFQDEISEDDFAELSLETARQTGDPMVCYTAAKLAASDLLFATAAKPEVHWDAVELLPAGTCGPLVHAPPDLAAGSHSLDWAHNILSGKWTEVPPVPMFQIVDVRDLAYAHVLALTAEGAANQSINIVNADSFYSHQVLVNVIRDKYPELRGSVVEGTPDVLVPRGMKPYRIMNEKSKKVFGDALRYRNDEATYSDYIESVWKAMKH